MILQIEKFDELLNEIDYNFLDMYDLVNTSNNFEKIIDIAGQQGNLNVIKDINENYDINFDKLFISSYDINVLQWILINDLYSDYESLLRSVIINNRIESLKYLVNYDYIKYDRYKDIILMTIHQNYLGKDILKFMIPLTFFNEDIINESIIKCSTLKNKSNLDNLRYFIENNIHFIQENILEIAINGAIKSKNFKIVKYLINYITNYNIINPIKCSLEFKNKINEKYKELILSSS